ncbi:MAG: hypothetical protein K2N30_01580 [Clostridia bacterium]|nr:hypothetical protein [Clostridia bacterium]
MEIFEVFNEAEQIIVYNEGEEKSYQRGSEPYACIAECWYTMIKGAHDMPAYGVSLNRETVKALNSGLWVEFDFGKEMQANGMPFEKLLINVQKDFYGFNLIRYTSQRGYDGRCFYFDLVGKNMSNLYDLLINL